MPHPKPWANLEIRTSNAPSGTPESPDEFDAALRAAREQTPEGEIRQVAFVLTWIDRGAFVGRVALGRDRYDGLRAHLIALSAVEGEPRRRTPDELVALARLVRARASMAAVHELLTTTQARAAAVKARAAPRTRR